ncbi:hypothetical protein [Rhodospira trueperi]|uniref:hypothetical protein n=1 Tax=Rhodospira trueperi TaxID=69960 RepID=UPI00115FAEFC|nr:hypothetical protein [Rhodospira trueperi]
MIQEHRAHQERHVRRQGQPGRADFAEKYNATWLRQRHGYKTPEQIRAEQLRGDSTTASEETLAA